MKGAAGNGDGVRPIDSSDPVIRQLVALWRMRTRWQKAELKLVLQAQAVCRDWTGGDKDAAGKLFAEVRKTGATEHTGLLIALSPFLAAIQPFDVEGTALERQIAKAARSLPVWKGWAKEVWGFSDLALGKIVGEVGDVGAYRTVSGLWSRCGLAPYGDKAVTKGRQGLSAEEWAAVGYSPARRSVVWNIGNGLIGGMGNGVRPAVGEDWAAREDWSPYQKLYVERLIREATRDPEAHARPATAAGKMSFSRHAHNRAKRYVEKRALRDLWSAWRAAGRGHPGRDARTSCAPAGDLNNTEAA